MGKIKSLLCSNAIKEKTKGLLENLTDALVGGDIAAIGKLLKDAKGVPIFYKGGDFLAKFY